MTQPSIPFPSLEKVLERAGLVWRSRAAQTRPCRLEPAALEVAVNWVESYRSLWEASFDRLDAVLEKNIKASKPTTKRSPSTTKGKNMQQNDLTNRATVIFDLDRTFDAPRERVWQASSDVSQLAQWWGRTGCTIAAHCFEFRAGGFFHYEMQFPGMQSMWGRGRFNYREIGDGDRIMWLNSFANGYGNMAA